MEDPQLAAMMVANAKKQALENTRAHWNRNHEQIIESTGQGQQPQKSTTNQKSAEAEKLAMQASLLREAANHLQQERQQQQQYASYSEYHDDNDAQSSSQSSYSDVISTTYSATPSTGVASSGVATIQASNVAQPHHHQRYYSAAATTSEVSSTYFHSDFSIPSSSYIVGNHDDDAMITDPNLQFMASSSSSDDDSSELPAPPSSQLYPASPLNRFGVPQPPTPPKPKMVEMSPNLVLPTVGDSESEDGIYMDQSSPAESPLQTTSNNILLQDDLFPDTDILFQQEEPLQFMDSPQRKFHTDPSGGFAVTPTHYGDTTTTTTITTPTKTPKTSNTLADRGNIIYQESTDEEDGTTVDDDNDHLLMNRNNITLSSDPLNELSRFEDEHEEEVVPEPEFPICAEFSKWTRRNRGLLCLLISVFLLTTILILIRTITADNQAMQDTTPPNLADTIKLNRTDDDDDFQIIIVNNTQNNNNDDDDNIGPATIFATPPPNPSPTIAPPAPTTRAPTSPRPTRNPVPTHFPTIDPFGFNREQFLFQVATEVSSASSLLDETTPQYKALQWLVNEDNGMLDPLTSLGKGNDIAFYEQVIDRYVMAVLYFATNGPNWRLPYDFLSAKHICEWNDGGAGAATEGVTCSNYPSARENDNKGYELQEIVLDVNSLEGILPREIGQFTALQKLTMGSNNLFGMIPTEFGRLRELTYLGLQRNYLIGSVPAQLGRLTKLNSLVLHDTGLNGRLPSSVRQLSNLSLLFLEATSLTGNLDAAFCNSGQIYQMFYSNCRGDEAYVRCTCCTHCCLEHGAGCQRQEATSRSDNDGVLN